MPGTSRHGRGRGDDPGELARNEALADVWWIGGGSGAGKTTLARRLAADLAVSVYGTDDVTAEHALRLSPDQAPLLDRFGPHDHGRALGRA